MKVYVLFHADIEDDRYVRGVYETREAAEADVDTDEWVDNVVLAQYARNPAATDATTGRWVADSFLFASTTGAVDQHRDERWEPARVNQPYRRRHDGWCCSVDELEVRPGPTPRQYGPFSDELRDPNATGLIPPSLEAQLGALFARPAFPLFDHFRPGARIGTVRSATITPEGIEIEATIEGPDGTGDGPAGS